MQPAKIFLGLPVLAILFLLIPGGKIWPIITYEVPRHSILGEDKTPPSSIKLTPNLPTQSQEKVVKIKGNAEAESKVDVYLNQVLLMTLNTADKSKFEFETELEPEKDSYFEFFVIDREGNKGPTSGQHLINYTP